jgi:lauroyl/myristoyl acyltransferase
MARQFAAPVQLVLQPEAAPELWQLHEQMRGERGLVGIRAEAGPGAALRALNAVQSGAWVALQVDRPGASQRALRVRLFGRDFPMPEGPFRIAKVTGAPLVAVYNARLGFMRYRIEVFPPIRVASDATASDLVQAAQEVADGLQQFVARHPTQWFHFYDPPAADAD